MKIAVSDVCKAFEPHTVGTRVRSGPDSSGLWGNVRGAIEAYESGPKTDMKVPGQYFLPLPDSCCRLVVSGVGKHTGNVGDYVVREWRGRCELFLKRFLAEPATGVAAVVYTVAAYRADPDCDAKEMAWIEQGEYTHVLVALLAFAGPKSPPPPWTFLRNLAFANNEEQAMTADEIRAKARAVHDYHAEWCVVAD